MRSYQPLVLQKLDIRIPGLHIRRVSLHQHLPETSDIRLHRHNHCQCLVYLGGCGKQKIRESFHPVKMGTAIFLPPKIDHAFHKDSSRRPICLVIDFDWRTATRCPLKVGALPEASLHEIRRCLAALSKLHTGKTELRIQAAALILQLLNSALQGLSLIQSLPMRRESALTLKLERHFARPDTRDRSLQEIAKAMGYQHDYLNRLLKNHSGLTLGQFRAQKLLDQARQQLRGNSTVANAAYELGFADANYFSRWFKKMSGQTPQAWRKNSGRVAS